MGQPLDVLVALFWTHVFRSVSAHVDGGGVRRMTSVEVAGPMPYWEVVSFQYADAPIFWSKSRMTFPSGSSDQVTVTMRAEPIVGPPLFTICGSAAGSGASGADPAP